MKRYLLFNGSVYYPSGGWDDFEGDFASLEEAVTKGRKFLETDKFYSWFHVVDTTTRGVVVRGEAQET